MKLKLALAAAIWLCLALLLPTRLHPAAKTDAVPCDAPYKATQSIKAENSPDDASPLSLRNDSLGGLVYPFLDTQVHKTALYLSLFEPLIKDAHAATLSYTGCHNPDNTGALVSEVSHGTLSNSSVKNNTSPKALNASQVAIKAQVEALFADVPAMAAVVRCESRYRQFDSAGKPLISRTNDVGVMQINIPTWAPLAKELGLDIYNSASDNILMGRIVYAKQGIGAWVCKG